MTWDGEDYQRRFDELGATGADVHGEAGFVRDLAPASVLDAGCGTGRVAIELARGGIEVVGVDRDASMLATARQRSTVLDVAPAEPGAVLDVAPLPPGPARARGVTWVESDLASLDLGRTFDVVVMAGNVLLFTPEGTESEVVAGCARHVAPGGSLVAGFALDRPYGIGDYDRHCAAAGLVLAGRWATWDRQPWVGKAGYAVSQHVPVPPGR